MTIPGCNTTSSSAPSAPPRIESNQHQAGSQPPTIATGGQVPPAIQVQAEAQVGQARPSAALEKSGSVKDENAPTETYLSQFIKREGENVGVDRIIEAMKNEQESYGDDLEDIHLLNYEALKNFAMGKIIGHLQDTRVAENIANTVTEVLGNQNIPISDGLNKALAKIKFVESDVEGGLATAMDGTININPRTALELYMDGSLDFAITHEVGHIVKGNTIENDLNITSESDKSILPSDDQINEILVSSSLGREANTTRLEEYRADIFSARTLKLTGQDEALGKFREAVAAPETGTHPSSANRMTVINAIIEGRL